MFTKTDLAKFLSLWEFRPHIVSRGAQKNFVDFAEHISRAWDRNADDFNETYFRQIVAKAIVFRHTERLVSAQPWRSEEHTSELQSLMRISYAVFCSTKK